MELETKLSKVGNLYIPKKMRKAFGNDVKIILNASAAVLFSQGTRYEDVLASMEIIEADIRHRIDLAKRGEQVGRK